MFRYIENPKKSFDLFNILILIENLSSISKVIEDGLVSSLYE
jgi:hypothetical protein